ncbi:hypothetical protein [Bacillus sp. WMMC1349]|nr:hypothetical protein [Bacillus sp. WMMC1349]
MKHVVALDVSMGKKYNGLFTVNIANVKRLTIIAPLLNNFMKHFKH